MFVVRPARGGSVLIPADKKITALPRFRAKSIASRLNTRLQSVGLRKGLCLLKTPGTSSMAVEARTSLVPSTLILTTGAMRSLLMLIHAFVLLLLLPFRGRPRKAASSSSVVAANGVPDEKKHADGSGAVVRVPTPWWRAAAAAVDQEVAARRALAKRRVLQEDGDGNCAREFSLFNTSHTLFTQSWTPLNVKIRGLVVLMHGLNEHSGRYSDFAKKLNANGFKVYAMDWIGHGGSDGLHAYVHSLDVAVNDLKLFLEKVLAEEPGLPCFCFGHSTGAAIILKAALDPKVEARLSGLVLTSPAVGVQPSHSIFTVIAPIVSFLLPRYQLGAANKKGLPVSRDPMALAAKYSDPLVYTGSIRVRTGYEILRISAFLQQNVTKLRVPFLVLHGTADTVTDPEGSMKLYEEAASTDKTIRLFEGYLHDLLFEPEKEAIEADIIQWLNCRVQD